MTVNAPRLSAKWSSFTERNRRPLAFGVIASGVMMFREGVLPHRPGQWIPHDIVSRVDFWFRDQELLEQKRRERRAAEPRIYKANGDAWAQLEKSLLALPDVHHLEQAAVAFAEVEDVAEHHVDELVQIVRTDNSRVRNAQRPNEELQDR